MVIAGIRSRVAIAGVRSRVVIAGVRSRVAIAGGGWKVVAGVRSRVVIAGVPKCAHLFTFSRDILFSLIFRKICILITFVVVPQLCVFQWMTAPLFTHSMYWVGSND